MGIPLRVLMVEDSEDDVLLLVRELKRGGYDPVFERVETSEAMAGALEKQTWDLILSDYSMPHFSGLEALKLFKESGLDLPFIIVSGAIGEDVAIAAMKAGAHDYLIKGKLARLIPAIEQELREAGVRRKLRESEKALRESEDRYRDLVEHSNDLICTHDLEGKILSVNPGAVKVLGYDRETLLKMNIRDILAPEFKGEFDQYLATLLSCGVASGLMVIRTAMGERRIWEYSNTLRTEGVAAPIVRGMGQDVTERKQAEKALRENETQLRLITDALPATIFYVDSEQRYRFCNKTWEESFNLQAEEIYGRHLKEVLPEGHYQKIVGYVEKALSGERLTFETVIQAKDGKEGHVLLVNYVPDCGESGKVKGYFGLATDITERKQAEEEKASLQEQLRQSQKVEAIGQLAGGIAHDFNNLLTIIKGYSQLSLSDIKEDDPIKANIDEIRKAADRAADLTRQLLAFSRRQILEMRVLDLDAVLHGLEKMLRRIIREDIELVMFLANDLGRVKTDPGQIEQVIMNLAVNARDAI